MQQQDGWVLYRLPGERAVQLQTGPVSKDTAIRNGFCFTPWPGSDNRAYLIEDKSTYFVDIEQLKLTTLNLKLNPFNSTSTKLEDYKKGFRILQDQISKGHIRKAILSRVIRQEMEALDPIALFHQLCTTYPTAFCYLIYINEACCWCGATPELLLKADGKSVSTVSLAGSKPLSEGSPQWQPKELDEQQIVTDYIARTFERHFTGDVKVNGPETMNTGTVYHLRSTFEAPAPQHHSTLDALIADLHPTPAIAGLPKEHALEAIQQAENHDRAYYTGYLGPVNENERHLFVNLRCMQLFNKGAAIYVGGGITAGSELETEWAETGWKAQTMLRVLEDTHD